MTSWISWVFGLIAFLLFVLFVVDAIRDNIRKQKEIEQFISAMMVELHELRKQAKDNDECSVRKQYHDDYKMRKGNRQ